MNTRILLISTYSELTQMAQKVSAKRQIPIKIYEGGLMKKGHLYAKKMENEFDAIISQGATAAVIKDMVKIPVVSIEISTVDILKALVIAHSYGEKIGLVCHKTDMLDGLGRLKDILKIDFEVFPYTNQQELKKRIKETTKEKMTIVTMGSCITENLTKQLNSVIIQSSESSVEQAIITAQNISDLAKRVKERAQLLKAIIDYSGEGIVTMDQNERIITMNPVAEKICGLTADEVIGRRISDLYSKSVLRNICVDLGHKSSGIFKNQNMQIVANKVLINVDEEHVGTVITLQEVSKLQKLERRVRAELYTKGLVAKHSFSDIVGESQAMKRTIEIAESFGRTSTTILIEGETGSGKELFAQSLHNISPRARGPFVAINCAALPENLLESELFGYEEGAFTGAKKGGKPGLFELADGGTIFLDEIGEMPLSLQSRLLRVLQEKEVMRIGGDYILKVDVRVIAATNLNLYKMVQEGKFREDLFYRISVLNFRVPPLRDRKEDIPLLTAFIIKKMNKEHHTGVIQVSPGGLNLITKYDWPGNVRELENFLEKAVILSDSQVIDEMFVEALLNGHSAYNAKKIRNVKNGESQESILVKMGQLKDMEMQIIDAASKLVKGDKTLLAEKLGISRTTLWKRLKELEINA